MTDRVELTDERMAEILRSLADDLDVAVRSRSPRLGSAIVAVVVVLGAVAAAVAPVRHTLAQWLRLGRSDVVVDEDVRLPAAEPLVDTPPLTATAAAELLGAALPDLTATTLGQPDSWHSAPGADGVVAVWNDRQLTLWLSPGLAATGPTLLTKVVAGEGQVERRDDLGGGAVVVSGDHLLTTPGRRRLASTTVLWLSGDGALFARLESSAPRDPDELFELAGEIERLLDR